MDAQDFLGSITHGPDNPSAGITARSAVHTTTPWLGVGSRYLEATAIVTVEDGTRLRVTCFAVDERDNPVQV